MLLFSVQIYCKVCFMQLIEQNTDTRINSITVTYQRKRSQ